MRWTDTAEENVGRGGTRCDNVGMSEKRHTARRPGQGTCGAHLIVCTALIRKQRL